MEGEPEHDHQDQEPVLEIVDSIEYSQVHEDPYGHHETSDVHVEGEQGSSGELDTSDVHIEDEDVVELSDRVVEFQSDACENGGGGEGVGGDDGEDSDDGGADSGHDDRTGGDEGNVVGGGDDRGEEQELESVVDVEQNPAADHAEQEQEQDSRTVDTAADGDDEAERSAGETVAEPVLEEGDDELRGGQEEADSTSHKAAAGGMKTSGDPVVFQTQVMTPTLTVSTSVRTEDEVVDQKSGNEEAVDTTAEQDRVQEQTGTESQVCENETESQEVKTEQQQDSEDTEKAKDETEATAAQNVSVESSKTLGENVTEGGKEEEEEFVDSQEHLEET